MIPQQKAKNTRLTPFVSSDGAEPALTSVPPLQNSTNVTMHTMFTNLSAGIIAIFTMAAGSAYADCVFAYNPNTGRMAAVAATPSVPYWSVIENQALRRIGCTVQHVRAGRAFIVRSSSANTAFVSKPGWVALTMGKQYRISKTMVHGMNFGPLGTIGFHRVGSSGIAQRHADSAMRLAVTGSQEGTMFWVNTVACQDLNVIAR